MDITMNSSLGPVAPGSPPDSAPNTTRRWQFPVLLSGYGLRKYQPPFVDGR